MTSRTHDLGAITGITFLIAYTPLPAMTLGSGLVAFSAAMLGAVAPDLDEPLTDAWDRIPAGSLVGKILAPLLGGHRMISHSILGLYLMGQAATLLLNWAGSFLLVDKQIVWTCFMAGYLSHLILDSFTREGVPWLFPIPVKSGIPPIKNLRIITGSWAEKLLVFPGLAALNAYMIYNKYPAFSEFFTQKIIR